ncbi:transposase [Atopobium sp. oral taxon 416]|uniref:IS1634 family transposase n=1 Tax=Atopobium sp. oral taxon 416 TaxID=712157 RepID=UPI001BA9C987|nr:transposase [Atopobium sp. oral taxon 416]QUC03040.1 transposase [Atopobium sp. oral taxon 416]
MEKARALKAAAAKRSDYGDSAKYVTYSPVDAEGELRKDAKVAATLNHEAIRKARALAGYNMIVTSKTTMEPLAIYGTYHRLWRIEESFRVMKSKLDARPVYLQRQSTITGHFLVCYIAVLLMRLLQVKVLGDSFSSKDIMGLCRGLDVCRTSERRYANISRRSPIIEELASRTGLPLLHFNLTEGDVKAISSCTLAHAARRREGPFCRQEARLKGPIAPYRGSKNQSPEL